MILGLSINEWITIGMLIAQLIAAVAPLIP